MTIKAIVELQKTHEEMSKVIEYLAEYETGEGADWSQAVIDYKWLLHECKKRATFIEERRKLNESN